MVELADTSDLGSGAARRKGSNPFSSTKYLCLSMPSILFFFGSNVSTLRLRYTLVNDFQAKGWKVLYAASTEVLKVGKTLCPNVSFVPFDGFSGTSIGPINNLQALASIRQLLRTVHPDVLFLGNVKPNVYGGWIAAHLGFKQIYGLVSGLGYAFID